MPTSRARALILTLACACGSGPGGLAVDPGVAPTPAPAAPPTTASALAGSAASAPVAPREVVVRPPALACTGDARAVAAPGLAPTWACTRPDGTRHGPFVTVFPDGTPRITGAHADGALDGAWTRHHPGGALAETGRYAAGVKDGAWRQLAPGGAELGTYTLARGTGVERTWYDTGELYRERALEGGAPHGVTKVFAPGGQVVISARYAHGALDGPHEVGTRGTMRLEETFARGVRRGTRSIWVSGAHVADEVYDRRGRLDGPWTSWRRPRVLRAQGAYRAGKQHGPWVWVDRGNNKEREGAFVDGLRDGVWREWWERRLVFEATYDRGKPDGEIVHFDRMRRELGRYRIDDGTGTLVTYHGNRKPATTTELERGLRSGAYRELTPQGKVLVEGRYRADVKHGPWRVWTPDHTPVLEQTWKRGALDGPVRKYVRGKLATEATYVAGKAHGPYAEYRDGAPAVIGEMRDGRRHGTWTTFDRAGTVILTATYRDGVLDGPWRQVLDGAVLAGTMAGGRRAGTWTRTDGAGVVATITYAAP